MNHNNKPKTFKTKENRASKNNLKTLRQNRGREKKVELCDCQRSSVFFFSFLINDSFVLLFYFNLCHDCQRLWAARCLHLMLLTCSSKQFMSAFWCWRNRHTVGRNKMSLSLSLSQLLKTWGYFLRWSLPIFIWTCITGTTTAEIWPGVDLISFFSMKNKRKIGLKKRRKVFLIFFQ